MWVSPEGYGKTKRGESMSEAEASSKSYRPARNGQ